MQANRLKGQVTRYKNQVKELEEREDELMKEKRHQAKEVRERERERGLVANVIKGILIQCTFLLSERVYSGTPLCGHHLYTVQLLCFNSLI